MGRVNPVFVRPEETFEILDEPGVGILVLDRDLRVAWANARAMDILPIGNDIPGADARRVLGALMQEEESVRKLLDGASDISGIDLTARGPRGEERRIRYSSRKIEQGPFAGIRVLRLRDVAGEERYRSFFRDFQGIAYRTTESGPVLFHGAVEAITGYTEDDFLEGAVCWDAVVHPDDRPGFQECAGELRAVPGLSTERVYRIVRKDGTTRWVRDFAKNVCNEDGTPALVQGTIHDAIGRREADDGLLSSNRQLSVLNKIMGVAASSLSLDELLEASLSVTIDLLDLDVGLTYLLNPERTLALTRYHHAAPKRYLARSRTIKVHHWPWNFVFVAGQPRYIERGGNPGAAEEEVLASLEVSALACIPILAESVVVGALFLGRRDRPRIRDEERRLLEAIGREIGSGVLRSMLHKRLEAAHRETNLYLDVMTHDLKNAGNVANLYCDLLIDEPGGTAAEYAKRLRESIRKSTGILRNVSTIRRIHQEPPDLRPVSLDRVICAERERMPEAAVTLEGTPAEVWADDLLSEIFANLIGNAVTFGGPGAGITIRVEGCAKENRMVVVTVEDTGPGIPDGVKEALLQRLGGDEDQVHGEGLGLSVVGMLVERYGGRVWIEDRVSGRPDLGAAFRFTLREVARTERKPM